MCGPILGRRARRDRDHEYYVSMHILQYRLFTSNLSEDHAAVTGFSGNTSRATHRGDFNCVVRAQSGRSIHLVDPSAALVIPDTEIFIPCDTLKTLATPSYWELKPDCYHTVIPTSSFHSSKTNPPASGFYHYCHHRRHTMVSLQSTTLNHHQNTIQEMTTRIRITSTAAHDYHLQWYPTTVNQQPLRVNLHRQLSLKIELNFSITTIV